MSRIPYIPQMEAAECGAAALAMVLGYYGHETPLGEVRERCGAARDGVSATQIFDAAESYGLTVKAYRLEPADLADYRHPLIAHWQMNHFVVVEGWSPNVVAIVDPAVGRRLVSRDEFDRSFTGVVLEAVPGPEFAKRRQRGSRLGPYRELLLQVPGALTMILIASLMMTLLGVVVPLLIQVIIDEVLPQARPLWLEVIGWSLLGLAIAGSLFDYVRGRLINALNIRLDAEMSTRLVGKLLRLPVAFFNQRGSGDLVSRVQATEEVRELIAGGAVTLLVDGALLLTYLGLMLLYDPALGLVVAFAGLIYVGIWLFARPRLAMRAREAQVEEVRELSEQVQIVNGVQTLKACGAEAMRRNRWHNLMVNALNAEIHAERLRTGVSTALFLVRSAAPVVVIAWGATRVIAGDITLGVLVGFQLLQRGFLTPLAEMVEALLRTEILPHKLTRMSDILDAAPEPDGEQPCHELAGALAFENVDFRYTRQGVAVLHDVSFEVPPGSKVAVVGPSGSGKSTLLRLLLGLYEPTRGRILFDGRPLDELDKGTLRRRLGVVLQGATIFAGTVRENISLYDPGAPLERVVQAARAARIHDHIEQLPLGYDEPVSAGAGALSGGQLQRLVLARAILHSPAMLILDEATSALDPETELAIEDFLQQRACTRMVVAHRLTTVRDADLILVLQGGRIVERGTHDELLARGGVYARLAELESARPGRGDDARARETPELEGAPPATEVPPGTYPPPATDAPPAIDAPAAASPPPAGREPAPGFEAAHGGQGTTPEERWSEHLGTLATARARGVPLVPTAEPRLAGAACLTALLRYHGRRLTPRDVIEACGDDDPDSLATLAMVARRYGLRARTMLLDVEDLRYLDAPLILALEGGGHVVAERWRHGTLHVVDASRGRLRWSLDEARARCTGRCLELLPEPTRGTTPAPGERLPAFLRERRSALFKLALGSVMIQVTGLVLPLLSGVIIDRVIPSEDVRLLELMVLVLAALVLVRTVQTGTRAAVVRFVRAHFDRDLTDRLMGQLLRLPVSFFARHSAGELMQRFQSHRMLRMLLANHVITALLDAAAVIVSAVALLLLSPRMALLVIVAALAYPLLGIIGFGRLKQSAAAELEADAAQQDRLLEIIRGITTLRLTAPPDGGLHRWLPEMRAKLGARAHQSRVALTKRTLLRIAHHIVLALIIWSSARGVLAGTVSVGEFFAFFAIGLGLLDSMHALAGKLVPAAHGAVHLERTHAILDEPAEQDDVDVRPPGTLAGRITMENVSFRYADHQPLVLENVSLDIAPGAVVALVGASGAGKSTLARMLLGFYRPTHGRVLYDGKDLASLELPAVRRQLGIVLQDDVLFSGSIRENIALGRPDAALEEVLRAAAMAGLDEDLAALPMGVETLVGEGGTTLSGGQRQKIAIARAMLARPRIVLFDEATSALDNISQQTVGARLATSGATQIIISHRISTIAGADRIIVLDGGGIAEDGTHDELLRHGGVYARLMGPQEIQRGRHVDGAPA